MSWPRSRVVSQSSVSVYASRKQSATIAGSTFFFLLPVLSVLTSSAADGGSFKLSTHFFASPWRRMASVCPRRPVFTAGSSSLCSAKIQVKLNVFKPPNKSDFSHKNQNQTVKQEQHKHPAGVFLVSFINVGDKVAFIIIHTFWKVLKFGGSSRYHSSVRRQVILSGRP